MASIHPTAIVEAGAQLDDGVGVGAFSIVRAGVCIGAGTTIGPHCVIEGRTTIGRDNRIFQFVSLGAVPQDKKYAGEPTTQSWAMCTLFISQLSSPMRVVPASWTVPVEIVQNSRIVLPSPITSSVGSPAYFLSCGTPPMALNCEILLPLPIVVRPSITQCGPTTLPVPMRTVPATML